MHSFDRRSHAVSLLAREILSDAQLLVSQNSRKELPALCRRHRRHHAQLLLPGEVRVEEFRKRHSEAPLQEVGYSGNSVRDRSVRAVQRDFAAGEAAAYAQKEGGELE